MILAQRFVCAPRYRPALGCTAHGDLFGMDPCVDYPDSPKGFLSGKSRLFDTEILNVPASPRP